MGFEPVTSRYRCDALTNQAMKPLSVSLFGNYYSGVFHESCSYFCKNVLMGYKRVAF